jgi:hypothetical protein
MRTFWRFAAPLAVLGAVGMACSSGGGGGGPVACPDSGQCPNPQQVCQNGFCVIPGGGTGGSGAVGGGTAGTGAVGGGSGGTTGSCAAACEKAATANCPNGSAATCTTECQNGRNAYPSCVAQFDTMLGCLTTNGTPGCDSDGPTLEDPNGACDGDFDNYMACVQGGSGGTGGGVGGTGGTGGTGGGVGGTGGGGSCGTSYLGLTCTDFGTDPCGYCIQSYCCSETNACFGNTQCAGLYECIETKCSQTSDINTCINTYCSACSGGLPQLQSAAACWENYCYEQCFAS